MNAPAHTIDPEPIAWRKHAAATLSLGLPLVGAQLAQISIGAIDVLMIGWLGARELAAATLATNIYFNVLIFGAGFAFALVPLAAQARARGDDRGVRRSTRMALWIVAGYAALMMLPMWFLEPILLALGQEADIAAMAGQYSRIMQWSLFPALFVMALRSFFAALEHARIVLYATLAASAMNALANYALIFGKFGMPELGLAGAAIASVASSTVSLAVLVAYAYAVPAIRRYELLVRLWRPDWQALGELLRLGSPISTTLVAETGLFAASSIMMGWFGAATLAAHGIALQLASIVFMVPLGLSNAATVRVGQAQALARPVDLRRAALVVYFLAAAFTVFSAAAFLLFPHTLVRLFTDMTDPQAQDVLAQGVVLLAMAASFQLVDGMQAVASGVLRGMKDTQLPALIAIFSYWGIGFTSAFLLGVTGGFAGPGVWGGLALGLAFAAVLLTARFLLLSRQPKAFASI